MVHPPPAGRSSTLRRATTAVAVSPGNPTAKPVSRRAMLRGLGLVAMALALPGMTLIGRVAMAQTAGPAPTAEGLWRTIDDETGKPRSLVRISETDGRYHGRIERLFREPGEDPDPVCATCTDSRAGQKLVGLEIMSGLLRDGLTYEGGEILDPANGEIYDLRMTLAPDGRTLEVRGFVGLSLFGRSQIWLREG
ncbi:DUF2147 domain-containing protein [Tistrella bauzanensis]|uniref:DUF2147 domain-containing protein n=1 Tax=Tistrella arctica TaxID=3133430 RepID=A0ABU9YIF4_9PROT